MKRIAMMYGSEGDGSQIVYGNTTSGGWVNLSADVYYEGWEDGHFLSVSVSDDDYTVLSSSNTSSSVSYTLYPDFEVIFDRDKDNIDDNLELQIAEKFKPVLHKHSWDTQQGLASLDYIINNDQTELWGNVDYFPYTHYDEVPSIHVDMPFEDNGFGIGCSFGQGPLQGIWKLDIDNSVRHSGAPVGSRPLYFHVYQDNNFYYLQYWFFYAMNDLRWYQQTNHETWHEGDWEHVTLKLNKNSNYTPQAINFYQHYGGHTKDPDECWWSSGTYHNYNIEQGYSENHTHLHIWIAANSHASYNRYDLVYDFTLDLLALGLPVSELEHTRDNCDYEPAGYELYFTYDQLEKLGEIKTTALRSKDGVFYPYAHGKYWIEHYEPAGYSKEWLAFIGRIGDFWTSSLGGFWVTEHPSPTSPAFGYDWLTFTEDYYVFGFGNDEAGDSIFSNGTIQWLSDEPYGD